MKTASMEHLKSDTLLAGIVGVIAGVIKLLDVYLLTDGYFIVLLKVGITALVSGFSAVGGKYLFGLIGKPVIEFIIKKYFTKKNKSS